MNPHLSLNALTLKDVRAETLVRVLAWVRASNSHQTLQSLSTDVPTMEVAIEVSGLLRDLGPTLRHLDLEPPLDTTYIEGM